jgi:ATP-binding cassette subfamily E protein 1
MRIAVVIPERCEPKSNAYDYLKKWSQMCSKECIIVEGKLVKISEHACPPCIVRAKLCPDEAVKIINLPEELETDMMHRYSLNGFRLFRLPTPSKDSVVGILGPNGMGKSTAVNALSGRLVPNLGDWKGEADWDAVIATLPRGELRDFLVEVKEGRISVAVKPQNVDRLPQRIKGKVGDLLKKVDERGLYDELTAGLGIDHLLDREIGQLSGGELQRMAMAATLLRDADVYFLDEPSSYLDIYERMRIVRIVQELAAERRVIVIEHDLAVLDVLADLVHIVYGNKGAFGIFTPARSTRTAINAYLDGFLQEQNVRIRDKPITFLGHKDRKVETGAAMVSWGDLEKELGTFKLEAKEGAVHRAEVVGVVGPNGTGKSTMIKMLAGELEYDAGWVSAGSKISYKPQHLDLDMDGTVQLWLDSELGPRWRSGEFNVNVIRALGVDQLLAKRVRRLSGGERQCVAIAICLGREADVYLLDEPSAHLDANARMEAAKAIRRTMESNEKAAFVIDHDVYFIDIVSDSLLVFEGQGGVHGRAEGPFDLRDGMNRFLSGVNITFRRDHESKRPRINKSDSRKDREQRRAGDYYSYTA